MARARRRCAGWRVTAVLAVALPLLLAAAAAAEAGKYNAVFNFGDSLVDAGNLVTEGVPDYLATARPPYGQSYFGYPTGRCSDGRLVVDFIGNWQIGSFHLSAFLGVFWVRDFDGFLWFGFPGACSARVWAAAAAPLQGQECQLRAGRQLRHHRRHGA